MGDRRSVSERLCVVYFQYPDKSTLRCLCTSNKDITECYGMIWRPSTLYDVEVCKPIPNAMFFLNTIVSEVDTDIDTRDPLDKFAQDFIKNTWDY